jgi:hypothetical protein
MLPKAADPETAEVIVCHPPQNEKTVQAGAPLMASHLLRRTKLQ